MTQRAPFVQIPTFIIYYVGYQTVNNFSVMFIYVHLLFT